MFDLIVRYFFLIVLLFIAINVAADSLRKIRDFCIQTMKDKGKSMANNPWDTSIGDTWGNDDPCDPKWVGVQCDSDFEEVRYVDNVLWSALCPGIIYEHSSTQPLNLFLHDRKLQLFNLGLYCDFTKFDVDAKGQFHPSSLNGLTELELSNNQFEGDFPQVCD